MALQIPAGLAASCRKTPERAGWLRRLPEVLQDLQQRWSLTLDTPFESDYISCSYVTPALANGISTVLKIGMPHMEGEQEILGLRFWNGDPTVRLLMADDDLGAMLLERCHPGNPLYTLPEPEQDVVIATLLRRMWRPPSPDYPVRPLSALLQYCTDETLASAAKWPDSGLVREGLRLFADLVRTTQAPMVLATDLHAGNVLRAQREPWLVIDPKPFVGDPAYDATQHLFNCDARVRRDAKGTIQRFADLLGVDGERIRLWMFARAAAQPRSDWSNQDWLTLARAVAP